MAPVTAFDGMPVITSNDLESTPFGITWGIDRTWVGMDDTGSVGNGWSIAQMPYLTVTEPGYSYSSLGVLNSEAQPEDRISLVEGGNATFTFAISPPTGDSSQYKSFASADGEPYSLVTGTDSGTLAFVDAAGDVSEFYDVKRDSSNANRPIPSTYDPTHMYGLFYKYTAANGTTVTANYSGDQLTSELITNNPDSTASEQYVFAYTPTSGSGVVTNSLVTGASGTVPQLISSITLQEKASSMDSWHTVRTVSYTYYNGDGTDNAGAHCKRR